jgi:hypothetical protein
MMPRMTNFGAYGKQAAAIALAGGLFLACGGESKQAESPSTCPAGTVLQGSDCLPSSSAPAAKAPDEVAPAQSDASKGAAAAPSGAAESDSAPAPAGKPPYDKDAVDAQLKRGARSVKSACGAATDDNGEANGPWGKTQASVTLGRNGHVKQVTVPAPYSGTPAGMCIVHAFDKIQFPPYAAPADVTVDWDVELVKPAK